MESIEKFMEKLDMIRTKRVHINFRLQPELFAVIEKESEEKSTTTTNIIEKIVQNYSKKNIYVEQMNFLPIGKEILRQVFKDRPKETIKKNAKELGQTLGREYIAFMFHRINFDNLMKFLDFFLELQGTLRKQKNENIFSYSVSHNVNLEYSYFLEEFLKSLIESIIERKVEFEVNENTISISFEGKS